MKQKNFLMIRFLFIAAITLILSNCDYGNTIGSKSISEKEALFSISSSCIAYVHNAGDDSNDGSRDFPLQHIQTGIDQLAALCGSGEVRAAAGVYSENLTLAPEVSLYGSYNSLDWDDRNNIERDNPVYSTHIDGGTDRAIQGGALVDASVVVDGFVIYSTTEHVVWLNNSSPTVSNNTIENNNTSVGFGSGIYGRSSFSQILNNTITGGKADYNYALAMTVNSSPVIDGNTIFGGHANTTIGIKISDSSALITNNIEINGGEGENTYALEIDEATPVGGLALHFITMRNNLINGGTATTRSYGIKDETSSLIIENNIIKGGVADVEHRAIEITLRADAVIQINSNNTINGGSGGDYSIGIALISMGSVPNPDVAITGNEIYGGDCVERTTGISISSTMGLIANNKITGGVTGSSGTARAKGIYVSFSDAIIKENTIYAGKSLVTSGIRVNRGEPDISGNTIDGSKAVVLATGITIFGSPKIYENEILGGSSDHHSYGIDIVVGEPLIYNNITISGGSGLHTTIGIDVRTGASSDIYKNQKIYGGSGDLSIGILNQCDGTPPVQIYNNYIHGGEGGSQSQGINNYYSAESTIFANEIHGGKGAESIGMISFSAIGTAPEMTFFNNTVHGGSGARTTGISTWGFKVLMYNNTIYGGDGTAGVFCVDNHDTSSSIINNIIFSPEEGPSKYGIKNDASSTPDVLYNDIYVVDDLGTPYIGIDKNIFEKPYFVSDTDWHFSAMTPLSIKEGGMELVSVTDDKDGMPRTVLYSMGAYEDW
ncbi:MAG: hypothetical protein GY754_35225 [bacterium]|nr:hypothetical protein [bacterium]